MSSYAVASVLAYGVATLIAFVFARRDGRAWRDILDGAIVIVIAGVVGAKLFHTLFEARGHPLDGGGAATGVLDLLRHDPLHWLKLTGPGFVFYGGVICAVLAGLAFVRSRKVARPYSVGDYAAPGLCLGIAVGRLGCLLAGCCYGTATGLPWAVRFGPDHATADALVHPVQLYDASFGLVGFALALYFYPRRRFDGQLLAAVLLAYAVWRFVTEGFRGDADRGLWLGGVLSTSQLIALVSIPALLVSWRLLSRAGAQAREVSEGV